MVKLTIVGRVSDGLPLGEGPKYLNGENQNMFYKQHGETILKEISRGALSLSKMCIRIDHHCFNCLVENGFCYITLCDSSYPRKLAFHFLQDLQREIEKVDMKLAVETITKPYSFYKIDNVIGNVRKRYVDPRTQANLSKLNANRQALDVATEDISNIVENKRKSEILERAMLSTRPVSTVWCSPLLEVIALKWTPMTIVLLVASILLFNNFIFADSCSRVFKLERKIIDLI